MNMVLLRVGARIRRSGLSDECKYPILNETWCWGFRVICGSSGVKSVIFKCVTCRKLRGRIGEQMVADLPEDRFEEAPPFTYCTMDMFGPFTVRVTRSDMKHYGTIVICLASVTVHIEVTQSWHWLIHSSTEKINCLQRECSNFVAAGQELLKALHEMDQENFFQDHGWDWITCKRNHPAASHMGGIWDCQIRASFNSLL